MVNMRWMNTLVLLIALSLCTEKISAGWFRRTINAVLCGWNCKNRCFDIPPQCSFSCFRDCGKKKRSKGEDKFVPLPLDYDAYLCDDNDEITLTCFIALLNQPNNGDVEIGFNIADEDGNGRISRVEFAAVPWFLEGEEDDAPEDLRNAANNLRKGRDNDDRRRGNGVNAPGNDVMNGPENGSGPNKGDPKHPEDGGKRPENSGTRGPKNGEKDNGGNPDGNKSALTSELEELRDLLHSEPV